jgi:hypothetical protein
MITTDSPFAVLVAMDIEGWKRIVKMMTPEAREYLFGDDNRWCKREMELLNKIKRL